MDVDPIEDEELLCRRVPESKNWYDPVTKILSPEAFHPHKTNDLSGLSVSRHKFKSIEDASKGRPGKSYYVAIVRVKDLRSNGIEVVPQPNLPNGKFDESHAELPSLNADNRRSDQTLERKRLLASLCVGVKGPFLTPIE